MSEYAKVEDGVVTSVMVSGSAEIALQAGTWLLPAGKVGIGYKNSGTLFTSNLSPTIAAYEGNLLVLGVSACSADAISYQWKKDNVDIEGAESATLSIPSVVAGDAGSYTCTVTSGLNEIVAGPCVVSV